MLPIQNKINSFNIYPTLSFRGDNTQPQKDKDYYTYKMQLTQKSVKKYTAITTIGSMIVGGITSFGAYMLLAKATKKPFNNGFVKYLTSVGSGVVTAMMTALACRPLLTNEKKLNPISEEEQVKKEEQICQLVDNISEQKGVRVNGIHFHDYRKNANSNYVASFDYQTGYLILNSKLKDTDLSIKEIAPILVHELTHTQQFANISRSEDGLYDFNKYCLEMNVQEMNKDKLNRILNANDEELEKMAEENIHSESDYILVNRDIDKKCETNFLKAVQMYVKNPDIPSHDLPLAIYKDYYDKVNEDKPPLTPEEKAKITSYLDYINKNKNVKGKVGKSMSATLCYVNNPIEIEANKAQDEYIKTGKIT